MWIWIIAIGGALLTTVIALMPNLPPIDPGIVAVGDSVLGFMSQAYFLLCYLFSPVLVTFAISAGLGIIFFEHIYKGIMWILRKIPVLGIK